MNNTFSIIIATIGVLALSVTIYSGLVYALQKEANVPLFEKFFETEADPERFEIKNIGGVDTLVYNWPKADFVIPPNKLQSPTYDFLKRYNEAKGDDVVVPPKKFQEMFFKQYHEGIDVVSSVIENMRIGWPSNNTKLVVNETDNLTNKTLENYILKQTGHYKSLSQNYFSVDYHTAGELY